MSQPESEKKYNKWIVILSIVIPLVVGALFRVKLDLELPVFLPPIYATINGLTALILMFAVYQCYTGRFFTRFLPCSVWVNFEKKKEKKRKIKRTGNDDVYLPCGSLHRGET